MLLNALVLESGYGEAGVVGSPFFYPAFIEAIAKVEKIMPVTLVFLLTDGHKIVSENPDLSAAAAPEYYHPGDVAGVILEPSRIKLQL